MPPAPKIDINSVLNGLIDNVNPENTRIEVYKGEELVHTVAGSIKNPNTSSAN